ncbi:MAG: DUF3043 domain-containing protein [Propionibacteriales bacterium]|nr:DUF3043 domain-containing protein [Propionibacteriales bacterium]
MFGRRKAAAESAESQQQVKPGGKGRPTPTRKAAETARKQRLAPPRTRKEVSVRRREQTREARLKQREALDGAGDDRYLPARDQGPVKGFLRDYVDVHRTIGELMIPIFVAIFLLVYVRADWAARLSSTLFLAVIVLMVIDSVRMVRGARSAVRKRFGGAETGRTTMYVLLRSWQMRRLRLPKPRVKAGATI